MIDVKLLTSPLFSEFLEFILAILVYDNFALNRPYQTHVKKRQDSKFVLRTPINHFVGSGVITDV